MATTKGEQFAGVTVALVTPFRNGEIDFDAPAPPRRLARRAGDRLPRSGRHHRRIADARPRGTRAHHRRRGRTGSRPHQGHARHRLQQHARGHPPDEVRQACRRRRRVAWSVLTTTSRRRKATIATSPPWPRPWTCRIVLYNIPGRTGSNILPETIARLAEMPHDRRHQGGDRLAGPGVADCGDCAI